MRNADIISKRLAEIKQMKSYTEALTALADIQYEIGMDACHERNALREDVEKLRVIILGNGNPELSIVARLKGVENCVSESRKDIAIIKDSLVGKLEGKKGVVDRLDNVERVISNLTRLIWLMAGVAVTEIVALLLGLL